MNLTKNFDKLAERVEQAIDELKNGSPTDALATLEKARREAVEINEMHRRQLHLEFWK